MLKRILSLACCLSLTVGLFTYRPPEAKAIVTEASLATSVLWSFMQSAGITLNGTGVNSSSWAEAIEPRLQEFTEWIDPKAASFWSWLGYEDGAKGFLNDLAWSVLKALLPFRGIKFMSRLLWLRNSLILRRGLRRRSGLFPVVDLLRFLLCRGFLIGFFYL